VTVSESGNGCAGCEVCELATELAQERMEVERLRDLQRRLIGACAPPIEALLAVHHDAKYLAPTTVEGLREAQKELRAQVVGLVEVEEPQ